jgi:hypothetical protein
MIVDIATLPISRNAILGLLSQSHPCPAISPDRFHSLVLQLPPNQRIYVCNEDGKEVGLLSMLVEQRLSHGGNPVAHITDLEVDPSANVQRVAGDLILHCLEEAQTRSCCRVVSPMREQYRELFKNGGFTETQGLQVFTMFNIGSPRPQSLPFDNDGLP